MESDYPRLPEIIIIYSHADQRLLDELLKQLAPMRDRLAFWSDKDISAGARWQQEIEKALGFAKIAVLLVSSSFLASDFIGKHELPPLLAAAKGNDLQILWIHLSACNYHLTEIADYQAAYSPVKPLDSLRKPERQKVLVKICEEIWRAMEAGRSITMGVRSPLREEASLPTAALVSRDGVRLHPPQSCLEPSTLQALVEGRGKAQPEDRKRAAEHLLGTPHQSGCKRCADRLKLFIREKQSLPEPENTAVLALLNSALRIGPGGLVELLDCTAAGPDLLAEWERWAAQDRRKPIDAGAVGPVILASYTHRLEPGAAELMRFAELAAKMADASEDPWTRAITYAWLSRAHGIKGQFPEARQAIKIAFQEARLAKGEHGSVAQAYCWYQSADLHLRLRDFRRARPRFERAIGIFRTAGLPCMVQDTAYSLALSYREAGELDEALKRLRVILVASDDRLLVTSALQMLTEVFSSLELNGNPGFAELALCLQVVVGESSSELGIRARAFWRTGRIASALDMREFALAHYDEARSLFLSLAPDRAGMYEAAIISLDMLGVLLKFGPSREMRNLALVAATVFYALGVDTYWLLALGFIRQIEGADFYLTQARRTLEAAAKRRQLWLAGGKVEPGVDTGLISKLFHEGEWS